MMMPRAWPGLAIAAALCVSAPAGSSAQTTPVAAPASGAPATASTATAAPATTSSATTSPAPAFPAATPAATASQATASQATASPAGEAPLSGGERARWAGTTTVGPESLGVGVISAAWGVLRDRPDEYGPNWRGFGKRYGLRLSGVAIGSGIEAGLGAIWDEDPRYRRAGAGTLWSRVGHAGKLTVLARRPDGRLAPAYARAIGLVGNNFITNAWRVESDSSPSDALSRSGVGVASRFVGNLFDEFWPEIQRVVLRRD